MADSDTLPETVKRLVQAHVPTPAHLETLVVIAREPQRAWTAPEVAAGTPLTVDAVSTALRDFVARGLLEETGTGEGAQYRIGAADDEHLRLLQDLVTAFERVPVQLIRAVYARPSDSVQSFSDAFRIQRPK